MNRPIFPPMMTNLGPVDPVAEKAKWEGFACAMEAHEPGPYVASSDNYYCSKCKKGMGNAYYVAARERDKLQTELTKLKAGTAYTEECLRDILELVSEDPEADDTTTALYVAIKRAEIALDPSIGREMLGLLPEPSPMAGSIPCGEYGNKISQADTHEGPHVRRAADGDGAGRGDRAGDPEDLAQREPVVTPTQQHSDEERTT